MNPIQSSIMQPNRSPMDPQQSPSASEIAFFDVETTIPARPGSGYSLLEFGAVLVCSRRLVEVGSYSTLIRPSDPNSISNKSVRCNGITKDTVENAPYFKDVADQVFNVLNGRVWAGHNIERFDCARIREAFAEIGRPAPEAKGIIDTLPLLRQSFGTRAGDMKMATLATYFGLGQQRHRSLDDVRMNFEVLKYCATVLFLESSLPDVFLANTLVSENTVLRIPENEIASASRAEPSTPLPDDNSSDLVTHIGQMVIDSSEGNATDSVQSPESCTPILVSEASSHSAGFLAPDEVSVDFISASQIPLYNYGNRMPLLHRDSPLQICSLGMRVQYGISSKFFDHAGRPKLSIVVNVPANLCQVLEFCDRVAQKSALDSGSSSEWRPVIHKNVYSNSSSIRLHIPTVANGDAAIYSTKIYKKEPSGDNRKLVFSRLDTAVLEQLFVPGSIIDACFAVDVYDFQQKAGIRLVAKRLTVHSL